MQPKLFSTLTEGSFLSLYVHISVKRKPKTELVRTASALERNDRGIPAFQDFLASPTQPGGLVVKRTTLFPPAGSQFYALAVG